MGVKIAVFWANTRNFEAQNGILAANMAFASRRDLFRVHNQVSNGFERESDRFSRNRGNLVEKKREISKNGSKNGENSDILAQQRCFLDENIL